MNADIGQRLQQAADLIDVLAHGDGELDFKGVILLCSRWHVDPVVRYPADGGRWYYDWIATIRRLAFYVHHGENEL